MTGLDEHLQFTVDPDAEPVDFDQVVARFLLAYVRNRCSETSGHSEQSRDRLQKLVGDEDQEE